MPANNVRLLWCTISAMPTYDFTCIGCDLTVERYFTFHEERRVECDQCGNQMLKSLTATPAHFKGGGWGGQ